MGSRDIHLELVENLNLLKKNGTDYLLITIDPGKNVDQAEFWHELKSPNSPLVLLETILGILAHLYNKDDLINILIEFCQELENIPDEIMEIPHGDTDGGRSEVEYRLAWARTYLKKYGVLENSARGVWALTSNAANIKEVDPSEVIRKVREQIAEQKDTRIVSDNNNEVMQGLEQPDEIQNWKERLIDVLLSIEPSAFERLVQRILRENGFTQVEVTGRTGDGGIDGKGIARINGFLSFHVMFQCKRYQGSVSASQIRDFRGAMQGRADKGLFITTGTFTRDAIREATRDGAPPIDLIDGDQLTDKLKELKARQTELITKEETYNQEIGRALFEVYGTSIPPDATFTLRITDGVIKDYDYNGTKAPTKTTFYGMYDRYYSFEGKYPWSLPDRWKNPPPEFDLSVPFNFISTHDLTGGASGSPVINKNMEIVGIAFDGNIESLNGDFLFDTNTNRSINVASQGMMECLKDLYKADRLVKELKGSK